MKTTHSPLRVSASRRDPGPPPLALPPAAVEAVPAPASPRERQLLAGLHHTDFLNPGAGRDDGADAQEDKPVRVRLGNLLATDSHHESQYALHITPLQAARQLGPVTAIRVCGGDAGPGGPGGPPPQGPLVVIEMHQITKPASLCARRVSHVVPPWHRVQRPTGHGRAGNALVGLGLAGLATGLLCTQAWACEDDGNAASSGAALGTLAGLASAGALECWGLRPLERPMVRVHQGLRQLWTALTRHSVADQLRAIVGEARESQLTPDGLEAVLDRCREVLAGHSQAQVRASGWGPLVLALIPGATGSYSGPMPDRVRQFVAGFTGEGSD